MVGIRNSMGIKRCNAMNIIIANIVNYDVILGMAGLQKQNPDICWEKNVWYWHTHCNTEK
jgi:hypothetical protein